jgi:L-proline---[L-prolyl-carrier protein] ligase
VTLADALARAAAAHPGRPALRHEGAVVTFAELDERAGRLAASLKRRGARPGGRVGLWLTRAPDAYVALWAALRAGCAYVPLDPAAPVKRVQEVLSLCAVDVLVTDEVRRARLAPRFRRLAVTGLPGSAVRVTSAAGRRAGAAAYILFTSGSTGEPKGVEVTHAAALAFARWARRTFRLGTKDAVAGLSPLNFDLSTLEVFAAALGGAALEVVPDALKLFPGALLKRLRGVTVIYAVPSLLSSLVPHLERGALPRLRLVLFAGEVFPPRPLAAWMRALPRAKFYNLYGPTETNVCTFHRVARPPRAGASAPIGRPVPGARVALRPDGEIWVSGPTVMKRYHGRPALTRAAFARLGGRRYYKTGDLASRDARGDLVWRGRKDDQIKLRGYRIEPAEVEAALRRDPAVKEAAVAARGGKLVAWVAAPRGSADRLRRGCAQRLPSYMIPETFRFRRELPKDARGKLDRGGL